MHVQESHMAIVFSKYQDLIKLEMEIVAELNFLASNPSIKKKLHKNLYYLRVRNYWIIYKLEALNLYVLAFLDARQDPKKRILP